MIQKRTLLGPVLVAAAIAFPGLAADTAHATAIVYDLSGLTHAPIEGNGKDVALNSGFEWTVDWTGAVLTHDSGKNPTSFKDDTVSLTGKVRGCVGLAGTNCLQSGSFQRLNGDSHGLYVGAGDFAFDDVRFSLDPKLTTNDENIYAQMDSHIGELDLIGQDIGRAGEIELSLKANPALGYAFRLFHEDGANENLFHIFSWILNESHLFVGKARAETRPGESVFNGDLYACRRGGSGCNSSPPSEVPEPMTLMLLGSAMFAGGMVRQKRA